MGAQGGELPTRLSTSHRGPGVVSWLASTPLRGDVAMIGLGVLLGVVGAINLFTVGESIHWTRLLLDAFMDLGLPVAAIGAGLVLRRSSLRADERWIIAAWYVGGIVLVALLVLWARIPELLAGASLGAQVDTMLLLGNLGGILGLIAGFNRARAAQNDRLIGEVQRRRDQIAFLNSLLRHNVLNSVQAIDGYATLLEPDLEGERRDYVRNIRTSSSRITELVEDVRTLINTLEGYPERQPIDLSALVAAQVEVVRGRYDHATIRTDIPEGVTAWGSSALGPVVEHLLDNAVVHNDREEPAVAVTVRPGPDRAEIRIADDGPGIPPDIVERYLEGETPAEGRGESLGLYLVGVLVDLFEGEVTVEDNDPRGSVVVVAVPRAAP